jgi:ABC-type nickel/cobalt efflux system permease component RcnA
VSSLSTGLLLGVLLGMRHALEPDHLAAVSTLVTRQRDPRAGVVVGVLWGLGHTLSLLAVGVALQLMQTTLPVKLTSAFELAVAVMLIALGARSLQRSLRLGAHGPHAHHHHGATVHAHEGHVDHVHVGQLTLARKPLLVGLVHGLAGSGALTALAFANMPTAHARFGFVALFGLGSIVGMAALTGLAGWPIAKLSRNERVSRSLVGATGAFSLVLGLFWVGEALKTF